MNLTHCPHCSGYCFTDSVFCVRCLSTFQPGELRAHSAVLEKAFMQRSHLAFLLVFVISISALLLFVELQAYMNGFGMFSR
jgi:hypothetical protein